MTPVEILTPIVLLLAFIGYVWCLSRQFWVSVALTAGLAFYVSRSFQFDPAHLIYWSVAVGVFVAALLVMSLLPKGRSAQTAPAKSVLHKKNQRKVSQTTPEQKTHRKKDQPEVVIDGTNVMYWDGEADLRTLRRVVDMLRAKNLLPYVFLDASSRHHLGDKSLNTVSFAAALGLKKDRVMVCPAQTEADTFILKFAKEHSLPVVSNDRFGDRAAQAKGLKLIKGVIANGKPILHGL